MIRILVGSGNPKKKRELLELLGGLPLELASLADLDPVPPPPEETGETFEDNAILKARYYSEASGLPCLADDSGLEVDALGGRPGVRSARYAGPAGDDAANNALLLEELASRPDGERGARYVCAIALAHGDRVLFVGRGTCSGTILRAPRGNGGFGYDPLFLDPGLQRTFAEIGPEVKAVRSHRGRALGDLRNELPRLLELLLPSRP